MFIKKGETKLIPIVGYADRWSVAPNETIEFKVSSQFKQPYSARLVRITCADPNPNGCGMIEHDHSDIFQGEFPSRLKKVQLGSYGIVQVSGKLPLANRFLLAARIWPTLIESGHQGLICLIDRSGNRLLELCLNRDGQVAAQFFDDENECEISPKIRIQERSWYEIALLADLRESRLVLSQESLEPEFDVCDSGQVEYPCDFLPSLQDVDRILIACSGGKQVSGFYNGKLEQPRILNYESEDSDEIKKSELLESQSILASWDFSKSISSPTIEDIGPFQLHGNLVNCPARGMKGSNWSGKEMSWKHAPTEYGAIHFHEDDIYDCNWETDFEFKIPPDFRSGMYSMRIECEDSYEDIPFYVRTELGKPQSKICIIAPTFTYTVYNNQARSVDAKMYKRLVTERGLRPWNPDDVQTFGLSTYNYHSDGSGICYSSRLRPSLTMRPNYMTICRSYGGSGMRHLPADTHLFAWLEHLGHQYDVVTDDDLHEFGYELLEPYQVVISPSHPEYHTSNTLDAIYSYTRNGGRFMYLGGNGFYWKIGLNEHYPGMIEIRRAEGGIRAWASEPGEYYNSFDGEYGGLWLRNGRPPQKLCGVGFSAQGDFQGTYYRRKYNLDEKYTWVFEGVDDEILGDFGLSGGGAAGFELDRADPSLGTPLNVVVLASSENYPDHFVLVPEEMLTHLTTRTGEPESELIRSDIVIFETPKGGYVFSVGSISYCGSLPWNNFDNNISKLTENVLTRFLSTKN